MKQRVVSSRGKLTAKQRVLKACPKAFASYDGTYSWHIRNGEGGAILAIGFGSSAPAWREAARYIK